MILNEMARLFLSMINGMTAWHG